MAVTWYVSVLWVCPLLPALGLYPWLSCCMPGGLAIAKRGLANGKEWRDSRPPPSLSDCIFGTAEDGRWQQLLSSPSWVGPAGMKKGKRFWMGQERSGL